MTHDMMTQYSARPAHRRGARHGGRGVVQRGPPRTRHRGCQPGIPGHTLLDI